MGTIGTKFIDITPNKSIYRKLGRSSHSFNESIAELIDNSIDAITLEQKAGKEKLQIKISLYEKTKVIHIEDNGKGMNEKEASNALILAQSNKVKEELGEYGFGLKTAALSLGSTFTVSTGQAHTGIGFNFKYDEKEWEDNPEISWTNFPINHIEKQSEDHGTKIIIEKLKIKLNNTKITTLKYDLGKRYRGFIHGGMVDIFVNNKKCEPENTRWADGYPNDFEIETKFGKIIGKIGLMIEGNQKGLYGFDLFKNQRMIRTFEKFAIPTHPTSARIMGEIHLDFVEVTHEKNRFVEDSIEYEEALKACENSTAFKDVIREARKKANKEIITKQIQDKTDVWMEYIAKTLKDIESILEPNAKIKKETNLNHNSSTAEESNILTVEIEKRETRINKSDVEKPESTGERERTPKNTQEVNKHAININGKTFKFKHEWIDDMGLGRKDYKVDEIDGITIYTNMAFPAFMATMDQPFYAAMNISEAIAEIYSREGGYNIDKINEIKDLVLKKASEFKNQLKEDNQSQVN
ncbi:MAG: ATP-binding protein [Candidatus Gracilibacteria bacterium]|nr:ATP-binding protein [Candidatus Gracilibacteria bacterium]